MSTVTITPSEVPLNERMDVPVGTGPYIFDEYARGQYIKLSANPDYWGETPAVTGATYLFRSDSAVRAAMVATGEADIVPSIAIQDATDPAMDYLLPELRDGLRPRVDNETAPTDDIRVRQALNYAVDREAFIGTHPGGRHASGDRHGAALDHRVQHRPRAVPLRPRKGQGAARRGEGRRGSGRRRDPGDRTHRTTSGTSSRPWRR